jgi:hypothetical protein
MAQLAPFQSLPNPTDYSPEFRVLETMQETAQTRRLYYMKNGISEKNEPRRTQASESGMSKIYWEKTPTSHGQPGEKAGLG